MDYFFLYGLDLFVWLSYLFSFCFSSLPGWAKMMSWSSLSFLLPAQPSLLLGSCGWATLKQSCSSFWNQKLKYGRVTLKWVSCELLISWIMFLFSVCFRNHAKVMEFGFYTYCHCKRIHCYYTCISQAPLWITCMKYPTRVASSMLVEYSLALPGAVRMVVF